MSREGVTLIPTTMRSAFLRADIRNASERVVRMAAASLRRGTGLIRRHQLWNKAFVDGPRPKGIPRWRGEL